MKPQQIYEVWFQFHPQFNWSDCKLFFLKNFDNKKFALKFPFTSLIVNWKRLQKMMKKWQQNTRNITVSLPFQSVGELTPDISTRISDNASRNTDEKTVRLNFGKKSLKTKSDVDKGLFLNGTRDTRDTRMVQEVQEISGVVPIWPIKNVTKHCAFIFFIFSSFFSFF